MIDLSEFPKAIRELIDSLTNIVGILESNNDAYIRISNRRKSRRQISSVEDGLFFIEDIDISNVIITENLEDFISSKEEKSVGNWEEEEEYVAEELFRQEKLRKSCQSFISQLDKFSKSLHASRKDLITLDYRIYEELSRHIRVRRNLLQHFIDKSLTDMPVSKLRNISITYSKLINATVDTKDMLTDTLKILNETEEKILSEGKYTTKNLTTARTNRFYDLNRQSM